MDQFTVEGFLGEDTPAVFDVTILVHSDFDQAIADPGRALPEDYKFKAMIDTGSRQCLVRPGFFDDRHFGQQPLAIEMTDSLGRTSVCRGQMMSLTFASGGETKKLDVPVYEMPFGSILMPGYVLIGRTVLDKAVLCYDGPNKKVTLAFADNGPIDARSTSQSNSAS